MFRALVFTAITFPVVFAATGCGRGPLPSNQSPPKDRTELEARYELIETGVSEPEVSAFIGKTWGGALAGYSTQVVKRKPERESATMGTGESDNSWASVDGEYAIRVVFRADGKARLIELLRITPMGPPPGPRDESKNP